jgi:hypothetical protein
MTDIHAMQTSDRNMIHEKLKVAEYLTFAVLPGGTVTIRRQPALPCGVYAETTKAVHKYRQSGVQNFAGRRAR